MNCPANIFGDTRDFFEVVGFWLAGIGGVFYFLSLIKKIWALMWNVNRSAEWRLAATLGSCAWCIWHSFVWLSPRKLYQLARTYVEFAIIDGKPSKDGERSEWLKRRKKAIRHLVTEGNGEGKVCVTNTHSLQDSDNSELVQSYFEIIANHEEYRFLFQVELESICIAPLHLVAGLLNHTDVDWEKILKDYNAEMQTDSLGDQIPHSLKKQQMFIFSCWLLWGPSIPLCCSSKPPARDEDTKHPEFTCKQWVPGKTALQVGFGDENNSLPLIQVEEGTLGVHETDRFKALSREVMATPLARAYKLTVRPMSNRPESRHLFGISKAQESIQKPERGHHLVLDYVRHETVDQAEYYSCYLWVGLVICDQSGKPVDHKKPWLNFMPVFEHANIASEETYQYSKRVLSGKVITTLREIKDKLGSHLSIYYACSVDDTGCGCQHRPSETNGTYTLIKDLILADLVRLEMLDSIVFSEEWQKRWPQYSSCRIPKMIDDYYTHLEKKNSRPCPPLFKFRQPNSLC